MVVESSVLGILQQSKITDDGIYLPDQLTPKVYKDVSKVIEAMGGKWDKKKGFHYFEYYDPQEQLDKIADTGEIISEKVKFQFFPTPDEVIDMMNLQIIPYMEDGTRVLEPSAGSGNIVKWLKEYYIESSHCNIQIDCCELNTRLRKQLIADGFNVVADDFLTYQPTDLYDVVIANPPFANNQDIDHVMHMYDCIRMGGIVVSVMSSGVLNRNDKKTKAFREFVDDNCGYIDEVRAGAFRESAGTNVSTVVVTLPKVAS